MPNKDEQWFEVARPLAIGDVELDPADFLSLNEAATMLSESIDIKVWAATERIRHAVRDGSVSALYRKGSLFIVPRVEIEAFIGAHSVLENALCLKDVRARVKKELGFGFRIANDWIDEHAKEIEDAPVKGPRYFDAELLETTIANWRKSPDRWVSHEEAVGWMVQHLKVTKSGAKKLLSSRPRLQDASRRRGWYHFRTVGEWINDAAERVDVLAEKRVEAFKRRNTPLTVLQFAAEIHKECGEWVEVADVHAVITRLVRRKKLTIDRADRIKRGEMGKVFTALMNEGHLPDPPRG